MTQHGGVGALVVMGVSGSGKSTVGARIAHVLGWEFLDADDFHPASNVEKMAAGLPLTDDDRAPWLSSLRAELTERLAQGRGVVLACSALRRAYRDELRGAGRGLAFLYLRSEPDLIRTRVASRSGHFFPTGLIDTQFGALEEPLLEDEADVVVMDAATPLASYTAQRVGDLLAELGPRRPEFKGKGAS